MTAHIHAANMALYARDAAETERPWERWEFKDRRRDIWRSMDEDVHPAWYPDTEYRRKPRTITVNGIEVPEPLREAPPHKFTYFYASPSNIVGHCNSVWIGDPADQLRLRFGLIHLTPGAAAAHGKAMRAASEVKS